MQQPPSPRPDDVWAAPDASAPPPAWGQQPWGQQPWGQQPWGQQPWDQQPWGQQPWDQPVDPRASRRRRRLAVGALGSVVVLLVALLGGQAVLQDRRADQLAEEVAAVLPELQAFVEQERGLPFLEPVDVQVLDDDAFLDALYAPDPSAPEPREDRDPERTLAALGLLDSGTDLDEEVGASLDEGVVGFYDPATAQLAVRGQELDAFVRLVLVHELTHALQDQHFDIQRRDLEETDDERALVFASLVEGDATRVEQVWYDAQPPAVQRELAQVFGRGSGGAGEPVVEALLGFPYYAGPGLVESLLDEGGQEALDRAFARPPSTTEQVLEPGAETPTATIEVPELDGREVDAGVLGVLGLALVLGVDPLEDGPGLEWDGDRYVTSEQDGRTCTAATVVAVDDAGRAGLREQLEAWAADHPDAQVSDGRSPVELRLDACVG